MVTGPYEIPNAQVDSYAIYTNNVSGGAFHGSGGPQAAFAAESQMKVALRLLNMLRESSHLTTQTAMPAGVSMPAVITRGADEAAW